VLVFCRSEGDHSQLWIASFDANGKPSERQITKYGGHNPAWSPEGDRIIYENNAQLWTVKPDGKDESPILVNDEPVLGLDPFWTR
jgi:Tol biopolymer transport system component